jgi:DNA-directed RNA polymerase subunit H (RpoH/RPB5)
MDFKYLRHQLNTIATYRSWTLGECIMCDNASERGRFRWRASSNTERVVALFADFSTADVKARRRETPTIRCVVPGRAAIMEAIHLADTESTNDRRRLVVLLLHSGRHKLNVDGRETIDYIGNRLANMRIETWHVDDFDINPVDHELTPLHRRATDEEKRAFDDDDIPLIRHDDPVVRWMGFEKNEIVAIERETVDFGRQLYFRRVTEPVNIDDGIDSSVAAGNDDFKKVVDPDDNDDDDDETINN